MVTRVDVIDHAKSYLPPRMPSWTPTCATCAFDTDNPGHTFHSCYVVGRRYGVMPYVRGGFDTPAQFLERIDGGMCPGGWDRRSPLPAELPGRHTRDWARLPPDGLGYRIRVLENLAGIDCSGYVLRCWGFFDRRVDGVLYRSSNMASLGVPVTRAALKPGDMLIWIDHHVRLFHAHRGDRATVFEAYGGPGLPRPYQEGDLMGGVIHRDVEWEEAYLPRSPFPQLAAFQSASMPQSQTDPPGPAIKAEFVGSGELAVVECTLDGTPVPYRTISTSPLRIEVAPHDTLVGGRHVVRMTVVNRIAGQDFRDSFAQQFDLP